MNHPQKLAVRQWSMHFLLLVILLIPFTQSHAQERFTVHSSTRSMENAKHAAQIRQIQVKNGQQDNRLDIVETDIGKIADHAWKSIAQCGVGGSSNGTGYKITWNPAGSGAWGCIQETDPTVKNFAKIDLPTCSAGQVLRTDGSKFICTTSAGAAGFEVDPYVQDFARNTAYTINACAADEILTMTNKRLRCVKSRDLGITETDPTVQAFAKASLPSCSAGQVLTSAINSSGVAVLRCVNDTDGGFSETDPKVGPLTNARWCYASGGKVVCDRAAPVLTEVDPKVGAITNNKWCVGSGGKVVCNQDAPGGDAVSTAMCFSESYGWYKINEIIRDYTVPCNAICGCGRVNGTIQSRREQCVAASGKQGAKISDILISSKNCSLKCSSCKDYD